MVKGITDRECDLMSEQETIRQILQWLSEILPCNQDLVNVCLSANIDVSKLRTFHQFSVKAYTDARRSPWGTTGVPCHMRGLKFLDLRGVEIRVRAFEVDLGGGWRDGFHLETKTPHLNLAFWYSVRIQEYPCWKICSASDAKQTANAASHSKHMRCEA